MRVNDITLLFSGRKCASKLYADDLKLYTVLHTDTDHHNLQDSLNAVYDWSQMWQLNVLYKKCNLIYVGNAQSKPSLVLNNAEMAIVAEVMDLGVIFNSRLNFDTHIHQAVA